VPAEGLYVALIVAGHHDDRLGTARDIPETGERLAP